LQVIGIKKLQKRFVGFKLEIPSLEVREGDTALLFGKKGAGKTATIDLLMNIILKDRGSIHVFGKDIQKDEAAIKRDIGFLGQYSGFTVNTKLKDCKSMVSSFYPRWDEALFKQYVELFGLDLELNYDKADPKQQQKFLFALLVCRRPRLFIIDEPNELGLTDTRQQLYSLLMERKKAEGFTVLMATSDSSLAKEGADQVTILQKGQVIFTGRSKEILETHRVIQGKKHLLTPQLSAMLVGIKANKQVFSAIAPDYKAVEAIAGEGLSYSLPNMEEICRHYARGEKIE